MSLLKFTLVRIEKYCKLLIQINELLRVNVPLYVIFHKEIDTNVANSREMTRAKLLSMYKIPLIMSKKRIPSNNLV